ncbi:MAG: hypothetical protein DMD38_12745 [Gemmatimonadetes bacterium]|nr:MAG: hypothetical protein DMD38_12745 [Gemmatimonadota bacterium]
MYGSNAAKSYGSGGSSCRASSFTCAIVLVRLNVLVQPRIARRGSLHILLRGTCCPLPPPEALVAEFLLRWLHFLAGITWIGLLYYFNFVQGPFMAEADAATKSGATQKLVPRALAWFRWSALLTFLTGAAIIGKRIGESPEGSAAWSSPWAVTILTGALFGTVMLANVWRVIWPKQKVVIASAIAAASGGQANTAAPAAARRAFLASRTNVVFSIPMLFFMGAASHFTVPGGGNHLAYWIGLFVLVALIEINALIATTGPTTKPIEKIPGVIVTGFVVWAIVYYGLVRALLAS